MARILAYAESVRGQLYPIVPVLRRLAEQGHEVTVKAGRHSVRLLMEEGLKAIPLSDFVEFKSITDWKCTSYEQSIKEFIAFLTRRAPDDLRDFVTAVQSEKPDLAIVNSTCVGACTAAMYINLPLVTWSADLVPFPAQGVPVFGQSIPYPKGAFGAFKKWARSSSAPKIFEEDLEDLNDFLIKYHVMPLHDFQTWFSAIPNHLYFTAEPFEYPRSWPSNVTLVGPGNWEPKADDGFTLKDDDRDVILMSLGSSYQGNEQLVDLAAASLPAKKYQTVITTCSVPTSRFKRLDDVSLVRFTSHKKILEKASCVVCCGGLALVQKAICSGVPLCIIPQCRAQLETAQRVLDQDAGVVLDPSKLDPHVFIDGIRKAMSKKNKVMELRTLLGAYDSTARSVAVINDVMRTAGLIPTDVSNASTDDKPQ